MKYALLLLSLLVTTPRIFAQCYWQQQVDYSMDIEMDVRANQLDGHQKLVYTNHSPDTLRQVFYHLYFNAFQPGSMMDVKNRTIRDPHPKIKSRISTLSDKDQGWQKILSLAQDGKPVEYEIAGTILQVTLDHPVLPGASTQLDMHFEAQVPVQIRRSGRDNAEGVRYTMTQWYPKISEYDRDGWHPNPYVGREFYGVWGDYDVTISIDPQYMIGATGLLQNPGKTPDQRPEEMKDNKRIWHFIARQVHDFAWAADPDFTRKTMQRKDGILLQFIYQPGEKTADWAKMPAIMDKVFDYANTHYGQYPFPAYSFIQGGDGGMEYPMLTMITGNRSINSLVGVAVHELMHSWFQGVLATNESLYAWMDEGFTSFASTEIMHYLAQAGILGTPGQAAKNPFLGEIEGYLAYAKSNYEEPLCTHADHFNTNYAYGMASYVKGQLLLYQLGYIIGDETMHKGLRKYFAQWKFKHPTDLDFFRVMEKVSGIQLDWYYRYWVHSTKKINYAIDTVISTGNIFRKKTVVTLRNTGQMPMPIDVVVTFKNGKQKMYNIPLRMMFGHKHEMVDMPVQVLPAWPWVNPTYSLTIPKRMGKIKSIEIDPSMRLLDIDRSDNRWEQ